MSGPAGRHRPPIRARRQRGQDLRGARRLLGAAAAACTRAAAGGSACRRAGGVERPGDRDLRDARGPRRTVVDAVGAVDMRSLDERHRDRVRTRRRPAAAARVLPCRSTRLAVDRHVDVVAPARRRPPDAAAGGRDRSAGRTRRRAGTCAARRCRRGCRGAARRRGRSCDRSPATR